MNQNKASGVPTSNGQILIINPDGSTTIGGVLDLNDNLPTGSISIQGDFVEGEILQILDTIEDADGIIEKSYKWLADGRPISNAINETFVITQNEVGKSISVKSTFTDSFGNTATIFSQNSPSISNINDEPTGHVVVSGLIVPDETIYADIHQISDLDGIDAFSFAWSYSTNAEQVISTDDEYKLTENDLNKILNLSVSYLDNYGNEHEFLPIEIEISAPEILEFSAIPYLHVVLVDNGDNSFTDGELNIIAGHKSFISWENDQSLIFNGATGLFNDTSLIRLGNLSEKSYLIPFTYQLDTGIQVEALILDATASLIDDVEQEGYFLFGLNSNLQSLSSAQMQEIANKIEDINQHYWPSASWYVTQQEPYLQQIFSQVLYSASNTFEFYGGASDDFLIGSDGGETFFGLGGIDEIIGGAGNDHFYGGPGADHITGGQGKDVFYFEQITDVGDVISDFELGEDKINFSGLLDAPLDPNFDPNSLITLSQSSDDIAITMALNNNYLNLAYLADISLASLNNVELFVLDNELFSVELSGSLTSSRQSDAFDGDPLHYPAGDVFAVSTDSSEDLFLRATSINDETIFEVVATPDASIESFDFTLTGSGGVTLSDFVVDTDVASDLGSSGTLTETSSTELTFALTAASGSLAGSTEHVLATFTATGQGTLTVSGGDLGASSIPTLAYEISKETADSSGNYDLSFSNGDALQLQAQADYVVPSTNPITPSDALEVLKTVVRINQSPTVEQLIAGDVDMDGKLTPSDALSILKKVVRMDGGVEPEWIFIDGDADYSAMTFTNVDYDQVVDVASITADTTLNFQGILLGDYDGTL